MRCPTLADLPPPPPGKTGWPWTIESPQLAVLMPDGSSWPRVSIVTPSYNQGPFIEETIRSVLLQGYPNLEYIVMDGGSTDETVEIISKYERWLSYWQSKKDNGQSSAINSGFKISTGVIGNWLNSDDFLNSGSLFTVAISYNLQKCASLFAGSRIQISMAGSPIGQNPNWNNDWIQYAYGVPDFPQESSFFSLEIFKFIGGLNDNLKYNIDVDFFMRLLAVSDTICLVPVPLSFFRIYDQMKTLSSDPNRNKEYIETSIKLHRLRRVRLYALLSKLRLQFLAARLFWNKGLIRCVTVKYDPYIKKWISHDLRP